MIRFLLAVATLTTHGYTLSDGGGIFPSPLPEMRYPTDYLPTTEELSRFFNVAGKVFLKSTHQGELKENEIDEFLNNAAELDHQTIIHYLLTRQDSKPSYDGVYNALISAIENKHFTTAQFLLSDRILENIQPKNDFLGDKLEIIIKFITGNNFEAVKFLLDYAKAENSQFIECYIIEALKFAIIHERDEIISYLLSDDIPLAIRVTQEGITNALEEIIDDQDYEGFYSVVEYFLSELPETLRPSEAKIIDLYNRFNRHLENYEEQEMRDLLEQHVPVSFHYAPPHLCR